MKKHLVLVGAGHAHLTMLLKAGDFVDRGHRVTVVSLSSYHYYSGMGPGMLSGIYRPAEIRFHVRKMAENRGALFLEDEVIGIRPKERILELRRGGDVPYDAASFNTGSEVRPAFPIDREEHVYTVKPISNLLKARKYIVNERGKGSADVVVIGGGAAGVEMAGNSWRLLRDTGSEGSVTLVTGRLLGQFPEKVQARVRRSFQRRDIGVREGGRVQTVEGGAVRLNDGTALSAGLVFVATGVEPDSLFRRSGLSTGKDGGLLVNSFLQSVDHPEIFGGGDCISLSGHELAKVGVYAVRQNEILFDNILSSLEGGAMRRFEPQRDYLLILNLGDGRGVFWKRNIIFDGRIAFLLKNLIDKRFMKKFQVSGEAEEDFAS